MNFVITECSQFKNDITNSMPDMTFLTVSTIIEKKIVLNKTKKIWKPHRLADTAIQKCLIITRLTDFLFTAY